MFEEKKGRMALLLLILAGAFLVFVLISRAVGHRMETAVAEDEEIVVSDKYNQYGLEAGALPSDEIILDAEGYIVYADRVYRHLDDKTGDAEYVAQICGKLSGFEGINDIYVMPIPESILVSEVGEDDISVYNDFMGDLSSLLSDKAEVINTLEILNEHSEEFIFYRTEDTWTALGAYYGYTVLGEKLGLSVYPLDSYVKEQNNTFHGSFYAVARSLAAGDEELYEVVGEIPEDPLYFYLQSGAKNREVFRDNDDQKEYIRPVLVYSEPGTVSYVGGDIDYAIIDGNAEEGTLLLIADDAGKVMASYLADHYRYVYVVDVMRYDAFSEDLGSIMAEYGRMDVVFAQNVSHIGEYGYSRALNGFFE